MAGRRFSSAQVTVIVVAVCLAVAAVPVGVRASSTGSSVNLTDPHNATNKARVNSHGQLLTSGSTSITGSPTVKVGNFPATQSVAVSNFPSSQPVTGTVDVGNLPATQAVSGTVNVGNLPATQPVSGTVNVGNLPATQPVSGTVNVGNLPATQAVTGTVSTTATTDELFGGFMCGASQPSDVYIDVSAYATLRVYLVNQTANTQGLNVNAYIPAAGGGGNNNSYTVAGGSLGTFASMTQVVQVPAKLIELLCTGGGTNPVEVGLFART